MGNASITNATTSVIGLKGRSIGRVGESKLGWIYYITLVTYDNEAIADYAEGSSLAITSSSWSIALNKNWLSASRSDKPEKVFSVRTVVVENFLSRLPLPSH